MTLSELPSTITVPTSRLDDVDALDIDFSEQEEAEKPVTDEVRLQWLNGLPTDTDTSAIGWHIKAGIDPVLDETMKGLRVQRYLVQHKRPDRNGNTDPKPYWKLRSCNLVIIAQRLQSSLEMNRSDTRDGIAFGWGPAYDEQGHPVIQTKGKHQGEQKMGTVLKFRAFVHELYLHGYYHWFPFTMHGYGTDEVLKALQEQHRVLEDYRRRRRAIGKNPFAPFYLFSIPLGPGTGPGAMKLVGEPQGAIYPIMAQIPATIDKAYLDQHVIPQELIEHLRGSLLIETKVWSIEETGRIVSGQHGQQEGTPALPHVSSVSSTPVVHAAQISASVSPSNDPLAQLPQRTWITKQYCGDDLQCIQQICQEFGISTPEQFRLSHFRTLVGRVQQANTR